MICKLSYLAHLEREGVVGRCVGITKSNNIWTHICHRPCDFGRENPSVYKLYNLQSK